MFDRIKSLFTDVVSNEVGRQNAIANFGSGMAIDKDGMVANPNNPSQKMHVDDYAKSPKGFGDNSGSTPMAETSAPAQITPSNITGSDLFKILKGSITSDDSLGKKMRHGM